MVVRSVFYLDLFVPYHYLEFTLYSVFPIGMNTIPYLSTSSWKRTFGPITYLVNTVDVAPPTGMLTFVISSPVSVLLALGVYSRIVPYLAL